MNPDNPYAAPQTALEQYHEPELLAGELPFFSDVRAFQHGADDARLALTYGVSLTLFSMFGGIFVGLLPLSLWFFNLLGLAVLLVAQLICWRFFSGLMRMTAASRLFLRPLLATAQYAFLVGWVTYALKLAILFLRAGSGVYGCCELVDSLAGAVVAMALGWAALRLGTELRLGALRRSAWLTMVFMGGSHLLFLLLDAVLFLENVIQHPGVIDWWGDSLSLLAWVPILWFVIGYFALMGLLGQWSRLPIRWLAATPLAEMAPDAETIARRRKIAEGESTATENS